MVCKCLIRFHHKRRVPHPYSGADDSAPSLTGFGMTPFGCVRQFSHMLFSPCVLRPRKILPLSGAVLIPLLRLLLFSEAMMSSRCAFKAFTPTQWSLAVSR